MITAIRFSIYFLSAMIKLSRKGGAKAMAAENLALKQQLITIAHQS